VCDSAAWSDLIDEIVCDLKSEIGDGAAALGYIGDQPGKADFLEGDRMDAEESSGLTFGIVTVKREAVVLRDLPPQTLPVGCKVGVVTHT
jgi:hypothetical protein